MSLCTQDFEKKEHKLKARAATNLAFLYSLEGDASSAERYADLAVTTDKYSAQALVNKVGAHQPPCGKRPKRGLEKRQGSICLLSSLCLAHRD